MKVCGYNLKGKHILAWMLISIVFQGSILLFLDKFYFKDNTDVDMKQVNVSDMSSKPEVHMEIPSESKNVKVSYDGKFIMYNDGTSINIANTSNGSTQKIEGLDTGSLLRTTWVNDRNLMLFLTREGSKVALYNYEPEKNTKQKIIDICYYSSKHKDYDIRTSTITGVIYVRVDNTAYRTDINQTKVTEQSIKISTLSDFFVLPTQDRLVYQNLNGYIYTTQPRSRIYLNAKRKTTVLGVDDDGVAYFGELQSDNKIDTIFSFSIPKNERKRTPITLSSAVATKDIYISSKGSIFVNNSNSKVVTEVETGKQTKYDGEFLSFYNYGVTSLVNNKYYKTRFSN
ncbi:hypothetical protein [Inconstantimicrobium mannanitabidum]|uniref:Uncharacterized protein n=1 Tax=Inconstantimicrobium mannanitabidum TaxID=1604901 RepID=A0ACB5RFQ3_9CLOT|nr:hypothetical protein [Clostridium sp. TW13]GKX67919.1 hypothetical protein rsdtw13_31770 [Clostridium sp. TW13]